MAGGKISIYGIYLNEVLYYVGQSVNLVRRKSEYLYKFKCNKSHNKRLHNAFAKHGFDNFKFVELAVVDNLEDAWIVEQRYQDELKPKCNVRKSVKTNAGVPRSDETKLKLSRAHKGKKLSQEHRKKISQNNAGVKNWFYGKKLVPHNIRKVQCVETGLVFASLAEASKAIGRCNASVRNSIYRNGTAGGYHWRYV